MSTSAFGVEHISKKLLRPKKVVLSYRQGEDGVYTDGPMTLRRKGKLRPLTSDSGSGMDTPKTKKTLGVKRLVWNERQNAEKKYMSNVARRNGVRQKFSPTADDPNRVVRNQTPKQRVRSAFSRYEIEELPPSPTLHGLVKPGTRHGSTVVTRKRPIERVPGTYIAGGALAVGGGGAYAATRRKK